MRTSTNDEMKFFPLNGPTFRVSVIQPESDATQIIPVHCDSLPINRSMQRDLSGNADYVPLPIGPSLGSAQPPIGSRPSIAGLCWSDEAGTFTPFLLRLPTNMLSNVSTTAI